MVLVLLFQETFTARVRAQAPVSPTPGLTSIAGWTSIAGSLPSNLKAATRLARVSAARHVEITVSLKLHDAAGLQRTLSEMYNPASPSYHHFLGVQEFAQRFGATTNTVERVGSWLQANGMKISGVSANRLAIRASGTASRVAAAFQTPLYSYKYGSTTFMSNVREIRLPGALAADVLSVAGLNSKPVQIPAAEAFPTATTGLFDGYSPSDAAKVYDYAGLLNSGIDGTGQTIAISTFADYSESNVAAYDSNYGLSTDITRVSVSDASDTGAPAGQTNGQDETEADIELVQAAAPKAHILVYEAPNTDAGTLNVYNQIVSDNRASIVSNSWGADEYSTSASDIKSMHQSFMEAAAQGQAIFSASGDNGAYDAAPVSRQGATELVVDYPGSDPFVTAVGGTSLQTTNDAYTSESAWSDDSDPRLPVGSGGGLSVTFKRPVWQTGPGVINQYSNGMRQVPDVSANADPNTGFAVYTVDPRNASGWGVVGGTSAATPIWAGFAALVNQSLGRRNGAMNYTLYALGSGTYASPPFHDVTTGTNVYYPATAGWDFATGWGSFDGAAFLADVKTVPTPTPTPTPVRPTISLKSVLLLHAVSGKQKPTKALKVGEAGTVVVLYSASHAGSYKPSGRISVRQNGKAVATVTLKQATYSGKAALQGAVRIAGTKTAILNFHITLTLGPASLAVIRTFKLVSTP
jgi:kumamolisin